MPGIDTISAASTEANTNIERFKNTEKNGLSLDDVLAVIGTRTEYAELLKIIQSDISGTKEFLKKDTIAWNKVYYDWIKEAMGDTATQDEKKIIEQYKKKLNSILPTLSPVSWNIEEENITLKWYIRFIETKILKRFNFDSNLVLGMQWIAIWGNGTSIPENIGTFDLQISFSAKNRDITNFIQFLNDTGNPDILTSTGMMADRDIPGVMSNPLITLVNFGLQDPIDNQPLDADNSGRATLRFYVRGVSQGDVAALGENIKAREKTLSESLLRSTEECKSLWSSCGDAKAQLSIFAKKFQEYQNGTSTTTAAAGDNVNQVYILAQKSNTLQSLEQEFEKIGNIPKK